MGVMWLRFLRMTLIAAKAIKLPNQGVYFNLRLLSLIIIWYVLEVSTLELGLRCGLPQIECFETWAPTPHMKSGHIMGIVFFFKKKKHLYTMPSPIKQNGLNVFINYNHKFSRIKH